MFKFILGILFVFSVSVQASPVNINTADADQIAKALKGIGPGKAAAIVAFRVENGPFVKIADLIHVKGLGKKTVESNQKDIVILLEK